MLVIYICSVGRPSGPITTHYGTGVYVHCTRGGGGGVVHGVIAPCGIKIVVVTPLGLSLWG